MFSRRHICAIGFAFLLSSTSFAEQLPWPACSGSSGETTLTGAVSDSSGARVTSATVQLRCGGEVYETHTDATGQFRMKVPQGPYRLQVNAAGFAAHSEDLNAEAAAVNTDVNLAVGNPSTSINVSADAGYVANDSTTATKTDTPIFETPQSISVVTRAEMDARAPQIINEVLRYAPGVVAESQGNTTAFWNASSLQLRGFIPSIFQDGLTDDQYGNGLLDAYFYQQVDVLAGPSSVLYGQGNPAGVVNVETKRPMASNYGEVQVGFGTYGRYEGNFDFSGPLFTPHLLYRLTGVAFTEGSQTWFIRPQRLAIAPSLTWIPDGKTSLTLLSNYTYNPTVGAYAAIPAQGSVLYNPNGNIPVGFFPGDPNFNETRQSFFQVGDAFTRVLGSDWRVDQNFRFTNNRNHADMIWPESFEPDEALLDRYAFTRHVAFDSVLSDQHISKVVRTGAIRHTLLAGFNYSHFHEDWNWGSSDVDPINVFAPVYRQQIAVPVLDSGETNVTHQTGVYFQDQAAIGRLRLSFAGREDWLSYWDKTGPDITKQKDSKFTVRTGANYLLGAGFAPYFSYATSFQPDIGVQENGSALPPTTGTQYEAGIKYKPNRANLLITAAVYNLAQQNVGTLDPSNPTFTIPVGEIRSRGAELQARTTLRFGLSLVASYAHTDSKYSQSNVMGTTIDGLVQPTQGKYQFGVPGNIASFWSDYKLPFRSWSGLGLGAGTRFTGASWGDNVNSFQVRNVTLFDGALHYDFSNEGRLRGARIQINASNIGNRTYVASCSDSVDCYYGMKLSIYGTVRYRW
jgi:iron complex outermembrane recepter protein